MSDKRLEGFQPVVKLMERIQASGVQYPKVRLSFLKNPVVFSVCGPTSRTPGAVNMTDGGTYHDNKWFGRITVDGKLQAGEVMRRLDKADKEAFWDLLKRLRDGDAEKVFSEHGHEFGECCMCGRELTNPQSVELGIGPVCRSRAF